MKKRLLAPFVLLTSTSLLALLIPRDAWLAATLADSRVQAAPLPAPEQDPNAAAGSPSLSLSSLSPDTCDLSYTLLYGTFLGGSLGPDAGTGIAVDGAGNFYVMGNTASFDFPDIPEVSYCIPGTSGNCIFVIKTRADGTPSDYTAVLGEYGTDKHSHGGIAVDEAGNAYVTYRENRVDPFWAKLNAGGTVVDGSRWEGSNGRAIAVDGERNIYVTNWNWVYKRREDGSEVAMRLEEGGNGWGIVVDTTGNIFVTGDDVGLVVKVNAKGEVVGTWPTRADGTDWGIDVDREGNVYVANVIGTQTQVIKFSNDGREAYRIDLCNNCRGRAIAVDGAGSAFVTGWTARDIFVAKVNRDGTESACAIIGESDDDSLYGDIGHDIAVDGMGNVYVAGTTYSSDFPHTIGDYHGKGDAFVLKLEVESEEPPAETITGLVLLQGRTAHAGTNIFLSEEPCSGPPSGSSAAATNDVGHFEVTAPPGQTYQCLQAFQPGYLLGQRTSPQGDLGTITLPAGDVIQDNVIDIFDLAFIAGRYHSDDPTADLNVDGWVDILDLVIAAGNYNTNGPVTNWQ